MPRVDSLADTLEMFIHHEDVRRAQTEWEPRVLGDPGAVARLSTASLGG